MTKEETPYIPKNHWVIAALIIVICLAVISTLCGGAAGKKVFLPQTNWAIFVGPAGQLAYAIMGLTLVAAIIERIIETCIAAPRRPARVALELRAKNAERILKSPGNNKDNAYHQELLTAELTLEEYRMETRLRTLSASAVLGAGFAVIVGFPVFDLMVENSNGAHRFLETLICGALVAGGAEPLHAMLTAFQKTIKGYANKTSR